MGFYDEDDRLTVEFARASGGIWLRQSPDEAHYLPVLLFAAILTLMTRPD